MDRVPSMLVEMPVLRLHQAIYRGTRGWIGKRLIGRPTLLLTTLGRRTGRQRTNALIYFKDASSWVVVASNGGSDHHPGWLANLRTEPQVRVQVGRRRWEAIARVATADATQVTAIARARWAARIAANSSFERKLSTNAASV